MLKSIIEFFKSIITVPSMFEQLEQYIIAGNPQTAADVEQLERGFYQRYQRETFWNFHE